MREDSIKESSLFYEFFVYYIWRIISSKRLQMVRARSVLNYRFAPQDTNMTIYCVLLHAGNAA